MESAIFLFMAIFKLQKAMIIKQHPNCVGRRYSGIHRCKDHKDIPVRLACTTALRWRKGWRPVDDKRRGKMGRLTGHSGKFKLECVQCSSTTISNEEHSSSVEDSLPMLPFVEVEKSTRSFPIGWFEWIFSKGPLGPRYSLRCTLMSRDSDRVFQWYHELWCSRHDDKWYRSPRSKCPCLFFKSSHLQLLVSLIFIDMDFESQKLRIMDLCLSLFHAPSLPKREGYK